jgi:hypothetical protein
MIRRFLLIPLAEEALLRFAERANEDSEFFHGQRSPRNTISSRPFLSGGENGPSGTALKRMDHKTRLLVEKLLRSFPNGRPVGEAGGW